MERSRVATISFLIRLMNTCQAYSRKLREAIIHVPRVSVFVGMMDYAMASVHDLLDDDASDGSSSEPGPYGSKHPSWECNMADLTDTPIIEEATMHTPPN